MVCGAVAYRVYHRTYVCCNNLLAVSFVLCLPPQLAAAEQERLQLQQEKHQLQQRVTSHSQHSMAQHRAQDLQRQVRSQPASHPVAAASILRCLCVSSSSAPAAALQLEGTLGAPLYCAQAATLCCLSCVMLGNEVGVKPVSINPRPCCPAVHCRCLPTRSG